MVARRRRQYSYRLRLASHVPSIPSRARRSRMQACRFLSSLDYTGIARCRVQERPARLPLQDPGRERPVMLYMGRAFGAVAGVDFPHIPVGGGGSPRRDVTPILPPLSLFGPGQSRSTVIWLSTHEILRRHSVSLLLSGSFMSHGFVRLSRPTISCPASPNRWRCGVPLPIWFRS